MPVEVVFAVFVDYRLRVQVVFLVFLRNVFATKHARAVPEADRVWHVNL